MPALLITGVINEKFEWTETSDERSQISGVVIKQNLNNMNCDYLLAAKHKVKRARTLV